ncbi:MAG TPA: ABC transporter permease [Roseiflexaceae bacterium]|nr:ABC transporter permease [Roseiflexaceae bacterium]
MTLFRAALWAEALKARRSKVPWLTALGFSLAPLMGGLFMVILKNPERARFWGLISAKAQLAAGVADWPTFLGLLAQATAVGGALLFTIVTTWVFGREFADRTAKNLLALPTPRAAIVSAKFAVVVLWAAILTALVYGLGLVVGVAVGLPGWSMALMWQGASNLVITAGLTLALMPPIALLASAGRGYLPPIGWAFLTTFLAQIVAVIGWGAWFPWSVPALFSELAGPRAMQLGVQSYIIVAMTLAAGLAATFAWWHSADQTR